MKKESVKNVYISNPFVLAYRAAKKLWEVNRGWGIFFIILGILSLFQSNYNAPTNPSDTTVDPITSSSGIDPLVALLIGLAIVAFILFVTLASIYINALLNYVTLQSDKGQKVSLKQAMQAVRERFGVLVRANLLAFVKIIGWTLLFIIPGVIASLRYTLLSYLIMDEDEKVDGQTAKETHDRVKQITKGRLWEVFGVSFTSIVPVVGTLFNLSGNAALYHQLKLYTDKKLEKPSIHWLNYFPLIVLLLTLITVVAIVARFAAYSL